MGHDSQFAQWLNMHAVEDKEQWMEQFERAGNEEAQAMVNIALLYKQYDDFDKMYALLAGAMDEDADAMYELANCYFEGLGGRGNAHDAFLLYEKAAQWGHKEAMNNLADMYLNGEETEQNELKALYWFEKAAELGVAEAMFTLGIMHELGLGTPRNQALAFSYYSRSAECGDVEAMYRLGMIYFSGELGQPQNEAQAMAWFLKASEQFHVDAMFNIGYCYENGLGAARDVEKAIHYYKQASMLGDMEATKKTAQLYMLVSPEKAAKWQGKWNNHKKLSESDEN